MLVHNLDCVPLNHLKITRTGRRIFFADDHEQRAVEATLELIRSGATRHPSRSDNWGAVFLNSKGDLPPGNYLEYFVTPGPSVTGLGGRRIVRNVATGQIYYTNTHYGDAGSPAFYEMMGVTIPNNVAPFCMFAGLVWSSSPRLLPRWRAAKRKYCSRRRRFEMQIGDMLSLNIPWRVLCFHEKGQEQIKAAFDNREGALLIDIRAQDILNAGLWIL